VPLIAFLGGDGYQIQSFVQERSIKNGMGACKIFGDYGFNVALSELLDLS
jgi:hypothetical protein